jgi:oleate hydratase
MMAVWGLTGLTKPMIPIYEPIYDLRVIVSSIKETLGIDEFTPEYLHAIALSSPPLPTLIAFLNEMPKPVV